jgi:hypothetical protein
LPEVALGLQAYGKAAIVVERSFNEEAAVSTQTLELPEDVRAQLRLGELIYDDNTNGFELNVTVPASAEKVERNRALHSHTPAEPPLSPV